MSETLNISSGFPLAIAFVGSTLDLTGMASGTLNVVFKTVMSLYNINDCDKSYFFLFFS